MSTGDDWGVPDDFDAEKHEQSRKGTFLEDEGEYIVIVADVGDSPNGNGSKWVQFDVMRSINAEDVGLTHKEYYTPKNPSKYLGLFEAVGLVTAEQVKAKTAKCNNWEALRGRQLYAKTTRDKTNPKYIQIAPWDHHGVTSAKAKKLLKLIESGGGKSAATDPANPLASAGNGGASIFEAPATAQQQIDDTMKQADGLF